MHPRTIEDLARRVLARCSDTGDQALLVAISGIDGAGKGYVAAHVERWLRGHGLRTALIGVDDWHTAPEDRIRTGDAALDFYRDGLRLGELFERVVDPLVRRRSIEAPAACIRPDGTRSERTCSWSGVDVVLVEGVFLLRRDLRRRYDLSIWVECSFETALERALARNQEGLPAEAVRRAYATIYFPAQRIHMEADDPRAAASLIYVNDPPSCGPEVAVRIRYAPSHGARSGCAPAQPARAD